LQYRLKRRQQKGFNRCQLGIRDRKIAIEIMKDVPVFGREVTVRSGFRGGA
jgi:hypothetical protein